MKRYKIPKEEITWNIVKTQSTKKLLKEILYRVYPQDEVPCIEIDDCYYIILPNGYDPEEDKVPYGIRGDTQRYRVWTNYIANWGNQRITEFLTLDQARERLVEFQQKRKEEKAKKKKNLTAIEIHASTEEELYY